MRRLPRKLARYGHADLVDRLGELRARHLVLARYADGTPGKFYTFAPPPASALGNVENDSPT